MLLAVVNAEMQVGKWEKDKLFRYKSIIHGIVGPCTPCICSDTEWMLLCCPGVSDMEAGANPCPATLALDLQPSKSHGVGPCAALPFPDDFLSFSNNSRYSLISI